MWGDGRRRRRLASFVAIAAAAAMATAGTAGANTASYFVSQTVPFSMATTNPCTGEPVTLTGTYHFESNYSVTVGTDSVSFHSQELKKYSLSGIATSGASYQDEEQQVDEVNGTFTFVPPVGLGPDEQTDTATLLLIRQGELTGTNDDFYVKFIAHITYNANGTITVSGATLNVFCR